VVEKGDPEGFEKKTGIPEEVPPEELQRRDTPPAFLKIFNYWIVKENRTRCDSPPQLGRNGGLNPSLTRGGRK
jgi:hypothetical protein